MEIQVTKEIRHDKMIKQRGEGGMTVRFMITAVMGVLLLGWVIFCGVQFIFQDRRRIAGADFIGQAKCEKCGTEYTVSPQEFNKGIAYYAKKFYCPCCKKREYAQVLNINEINEDMRQQRYEELKERYFQEDTE